MDELHILLLILVIFLAVNFYKSFDKQDKILKKQGDRFASGQELCERLFEISSRVEAMLPEGEADVTDEINGIGIKLTKLISPGSKLNEKISRADFKGDGIYNAGVFHPFDQT
ncbi:hypothetical protein [Hellea balneolensis]|uniref:hypothetical protein n=1 Tax=Hellea balneolensis TaxID=287478 RepID=UPI0004074E4D|nr:hypothetical protein [Hellea balneolensis]